MAPRIDLWSRRVTRDGVEVHRTPNEFRRLSILARSAGKVLTHATLLSELSGPGARTQGHYLRVYMNQLRHKLERDPGRPQLLVTETGVGYRLRLEG